MSAPTFRDFDLDGAPFEGQKSLFNVVRVEYETNFLKHDYDAQQLQIGPGDVVVVEGEKGPVLASVRSHVHRKVVDKGSMLRVLRVANDHDLTQAARNQEMERTAYAFAIQRIRARKLPMKLVRAQWIHDGSKVVFFFSADGRVDFRDLVKDLAHRFRTRIEMHQIGVRDGTRMIGGIGPCGRELCCSTFLEKFAPVSIRMAKDQGLTLNPRKVSGQCGRLMCCLVYEQQLYRRERKRMPRSGRKVRTELGTGKIIDIDIINKRVHVSLDDGSRKLFELADVVLLDGSGEEAPPEPVAASDYLWDGLGQATLEDDPGADESDDTPKRRRRRSRGNRRGESGKSGRKKSGRQKKSGQKKSGRKSGGQQKKSGQKSSGGQQKKSSQKSKSRRRRKKKPSDGSSDGSKGGGDK